MWRLFFLILIFSFAFPVNAIIKFEPKWKTVTVLKVVDNEHFMLKNQKVIKIIGIEAPSIYLPKKNEKCLSRPIFRTLSQLLNGQTIKIFETNYQNQNYEYPRHIKLSNGKNLSEFMLKRGLVKFDKNYKDKKYRKKYLEAESFAQENKLGLHSGCNAWNNLKHRQKKHGIFMPFFNKYSVYLAGISTGIVVEVLSGNTFKLENGLKIRLIGVSVPNSEKNNFKCFSSESKKYLEDFILNRKVFLVKDRLQLDNEGFLLRYVYLANDELVNKKIIQNGYGKSEWLDRNDKFKKEFNNLQQKIYKNPNGAWKSCVGDLLTNYNKNKTEKNIKKELIYDKTCRIKGNISGSKKTPKKTYHTPNSGWYNRLKYEKCFETEKEAQKAGFKKVK